MSQPPLFTAVAVRSLLLLRCYILPLRESGAVSGDTSRFEPCGGGF